MADSSLPPSIPMDEWHVRLATIRNSKRIPDYSELVDLCKQSPWLRYAFDTDMHENPEDIIGPNVANEVKFALGLTPWSKRPTPTDELVEQFFHETIKASESSREIFDGLANGLAIALRRRKEIPECALNWIADNLSQRLAIPKRKAGSHPMVNRERDVHLRHFFRDIQSLGVGITENEATYREGSAAHAIVEALGSSFSVPNAKTLMNIWSKRSRG